MTAYAPETPDLLTLDPEAQDLLFREARTANTFTDEPVTHAQVQAIYDLIKWAPTAMNAQPLRMVLLESAESRARLLPLMGEGNRAKTETAPMTVLLAADTSFHEELPRTFPHATGLKDMFEDNAAARQRTARLNSSLQVGYFILGARAAGLAAGPMTGFDVDAVSAEFFPDGDHEVLVVVNLGHPGEGAWMQRLPRLDFDEVVTAL